MTPLNIPKRIKRPDTETRKEKSLIVSVVSSMRGGSKTEKLIRKLTRSINIFSSKPGDKRSSYFKMQFEQLRGIWRIWSNISTIGVNFSTN